MADLSPQELAVFQQGMTDQQKMRFITEYNAAKKDRTTAIILALLVGTLGIDRFYVGDTGLGVLKLLTAGVCGIMTVVDWFIIMGRVDAHNRGKAAEIASVVRAS